MFLILIYLKLVIPDNELMRKMLNLSLIKVNKLNIRFLLKIKLKLYKINVKRV